MAEHFLNGVDIGTICQQMCREVMTQCVRCDRLFDAGLGLIVLDELPEALTAHRLSCAVGKQCLLRFLRYQSLSAMLQIRFQRCFRFISKRNRTLAVLFRTEQKGQF